MFIKADLHIHTADDPTDPLSLDSKELIDKAAKLGIKVLAFTCHEQYNCSKEYDSYAKEQGLLIIHGGEKQIAGKDVLIYNVPVQAFDQVKTFEDLRNLKKDHPESLLIAPHPYYAILSLKEDLESNIDLFDAIEWSHFYTSCYNPNKKAQKTAEKFHLPLLASSDTHFACQFGKNISEIEIASLNTDEVIRSIKAGKIKFTPKALNMFELARILLNMLKLNLKIILKRHA
ncbi:MAG: PHP-associated domain-containing protein [Candidatus Gracilibacteria bacterium]|nr:PHP-associated domain-containing protein [Candidatus Gracilibacteria bacterium]